MTYTVSGTVLEASIGATIANASVVWKDSAGTQLGTTSTDSTGSYSLSADVSDSALPDTWEVSVSHPGYEPGLKQISASTSTASYTKDFSLTSILQVNDGGTWKGPKSVWVNDGGTWKEAKEVYVNDGGTWKRVR